MSDGKELSNQVAALGTPVTTGGATFTGNILRDGFGGYYCAHSGSDTAPRIYRLVDGSPAPSSPPSGSLVIYHAA